MYPVILLMPKLDTLQYSTYLRSLKCRLADILESNLEIFFKICFVLTFYFLSIYCTSMLSFFKHYQIVFTGFLYLSPV